MGTVADAARAGVGRSRGRRGWRAAALCGGAAVPVVGAYVVGAWSARSGGRVAVAELLDRPVLLLGTAALLLAAALVLAPPTRGRTAFAVPAVLVGGVLVLRVLVGVLDVAAPERETVRVTTAPGRDDRVLVVVLHAAGPGTERRWSVEVELGRGWSARRWLLGVFGAGTPGGPFEDCRWAGPDRIVVRAADGDHAYEVAEGSGGPRAVPPRPGDGSPPGR